MRKLRKQLLDLLDPKRLAGGAFYGMIYLFFLLLIYLIFLVIKAVISGVLS